MDANVQSNEYVIVILGNGLQLELKLVLQLNFVKWVVQFVSKKSLRTVFKKSHLIFSYRAQFYVSAKKFSQIFSAVLAKIQRFTFSAKESGRII